VNRGNRVNIQQKHTVVYLKPAENLMTNKLKYGRIHWDWPLNNLKRLPIFNSEYFCRKTKTIRPHAI